MVDKNCPDRDSNKAMSDELKWLRQEKWADENSAGFLADCARLQAGEPLAYVIGHLPFLNTKIYLDTKPLIPRVETEYWVAELIKEIADKECKAGEATPRPLSILDLCAGSGCIGTALALAYPLALITFAEIDCSHLPTIKKNLTENLTQNSRAYSEQYQIIQSDLFASLPKNQKYDYIISNPPYIDQALNRTAINVKDHEPALALYGGQAGLEIISQIISQAPQWLNARGELWLEHEPEQTTTIHQLATQQFRVSTHQDQYKVERYSRLVLQ